MPNPVAILAAIGALVGVGFAASGSSSSSSKKTAGIPPMPQGFPPGITPPDLPGFPFPPSPPDGQFPGGGIIPAGFPIPPIGGDGQGSPPIGAGDMRRFAPVKAGEGPYQFVSRVSGPSYADKSRTGGTWGWKALMGVNPSLKLNAAGDNFTNDTWTPGLLVRIPDAWPGGSVGGGAVGGGGGLFNGVFT